MEKRQENYRELASQYFLKNYEFVQMIAFESAPAKHLVEDIVNDVYIVFVNRADHWDYSNVRGILYQITKNVGMNYWQNWIKTLPDSLKRIALQLQRTSQLDDHENDFVQDGLESERLSALRHCMGQLTERSRLLIDEHYLLGRKLSEIADQTSENQNTLRNRIFRIRQALRRCIDSLLRKGVINE